MKILPLERSRHTDEAIETSERLPWPAAMLVILGVSLLLWSAVAYGVNALIG